MKMLGERGPGAVRIDALCDRLGVTKGSFYWHFADRKDLLRQLLDHWEYKETLSIIERVEALGGPPAERIWSLLQEGLSGGVDFSAELAIRHWARNDKLVAAAVKRVDGERIEYLEELLRELGFEPQTATTKALLVYSINLSQGAIVRREAKAMRVARLRESLALVLGGGIATDRATDHCGDEQEPPARLAARR